MEQSESRFTMTLEPEAARALAHGIGTDLGILSQELEKLAGVASEGDRITIEHVRAAGTVLPTQDRWRWFDLVGERRFDEAVASLGVLLGQGETGVGLVIGLTTQLLRLGVASKEGARGLEATLPPHQKWLAARVAAQAKKWPPEEIGTALEGLLRVDRLLKASPHTDYHFLEEWLLAMMTKSRAA